MDVTTMRMLSQYVVTLAFAYAQFLMCPVRRPVVFFVGVTIVHFAPFLLGESSLGASTVQATFLYFLLPLICFDGSLPARALSIALSFSILITGEVLMCAVYVAVCGQTIGDMAGLYASPAPYYIVQVADIGFIILAARLMAPRVRGLLHSGRAPAIVRSIWIIPLCSISLSVVCTQAMSSFAGDSGALWPYIPFALINVTLDIVCLRLMDRLRLEAVERERADIMEAQLDGILGRYDEIARRAARSAQLRHDARNHLQVLDSLVARGEHERAQEYAASLAKEYSGR